MTVSFPIVFVTADVFQKRSATGALEAFGMPTLVHGGDDAANYRIIAPRTEYARDRPLHRLGTCRVNPTMWLIISWYDYYGHLREPYWARGIRRFVVAW